MARSVRQSMRKVESKNTIEDITLLLDTYSIESQNLHNSFIVSDIPCNVVVINDDGFLPDGVDSLYQYFLGSISISGKPKYFNEVKVPDYWEITSTNNSGEIHDLHHLRGRIFYSEPTNARHVRCVEWLDESGVVRACDYYNKCGNLFAKSTFDKNQKIILKSFFDLNGKEVIVENYITNDIIVNYNNKVNIFRSKVEFVLYYLKLRGLDHTRLFINSLGVPFFASNNLDENDKGDVLFWQEYKRKDIPGNMQFILDGNAKRINKIYVQKKDSYDALIKLGASKDMLKCMGYVYPFNRNSKHRKEALVMTNSDNILHIEDMIKELPMIHFHVAALTEMSAKLMAIGKYDNVTLYPTITMQKIPSLYEKCDIYLDVNKENEIVQAVNRAFLSNLVIFAFDETIHNINYIAKDNRYKADDYSKLIEDINNICYDTNKWNKRLKLQRNHALSEEKERYANI